MPGTWTPPSPLFSFAHLPPSLPACQLPLMQPFVSLTVRSGSGGRAAAAAACRRVEGAAEAVLRLRVQVGKGCLPLISALRSFNRLLGRSIRNGACSALLHGRSIASLESPP
jgi:hypothetical protein